MSLFSYIDPFTGSVLLQVLMAGFLGIVAFFRPLWAWLHKSSSKRAEALDFLAEEQNALTPADDDVDQT